MQEYTVDQMVTRVIRMCVADHMAEDRLAVDDWHPRAEMMEDVCPGEEAPPWLRNWSSIPHTERTKWRLEDLRIDRHDMSDADGFGRPVCKTAYEILRDGSFEVLGKSRGFETEYSRRDCIVIRVQYGRDGQACADYEVGPTRSLRPLLWQD